MAEVFISYAREDFEFAKKLYDALIRLKRSVWMDLSDIPPATNSSIFSSRCACISSDTSLKSRSRENNCFSQFIIHPALRHVLFLRACAQSSIRHVPGASRPPMSNGKSEHDGWWRKRPTPP